MHRHRDALRKKKTGRYLNDRDFNEAAGFVIKRAGETWLAVRPDKWREHFGGQNHSTLKARQADGRLWGVDGLQRQMKLRESRAKDRVYCVKILAPLE